MVRILSFLLASLLSNAAHAQGDEALRARLTAEYASTHALSTGCSLGEVERRTGRLDDAEAHLDAVIAAAQVPGADIDVNTLSACYFNRARVYEDRGALERAYALLGTALETQNVDRRRTVEGRMASVAARLVERSGCSALRSRFSAEGLLRFADEPALRRCVTESRRARPFCVSARVRDLPAEDDLYGARRVTEDLDAVLDEGALLLITYRGERRVSALRCLLPGSDERLSDARAITFAGQTFVSIDTTTTTTYSCDCEGESSPEDDCRCSDMSGARYLVTLRGQLVLALGAPWSEHDGMATWGAYADEMQDMSESTDVVQGDVIVINGRRLTLHSGLLVPAPEPRR